MYFFFFFILLLKWNIWTAKECQIKKKLNRWMSNWNQRTSSTSRTSSSQFEYGIVSPKYQRYISIDSGNYIKNALIPKFLYHSHSLFEWESKLIVCSFDKHQQKLAIESALQLYQIQLIPTLYMVWRDVCNHFLVSNLILALTLLIWTPRSYFSWNALWLLVNVAMIFACQSWMDSIIFRWVSNTPFYC